MAALHTITNIELISKYMGIEQGNKGESDSLIRKCTEFSSKQNKDNILMLFITIGLLGNDQSRPPALIYHKEIINIRDQTQLLAVLFMFNCISAILPRIDPQDHTPCT